MGPRLLVVGWDAATASHLESFDLPFYAGLDHHDRLLPEPFWQTREVDSGSAWTTITTGLSMWDHGVVTISGMLKYQTPFELFSRVDWTIPENLLGIPARIWARRLFLGDAPTNDDIPYKRVWHYIPDSLATFVPVTHPPKPTDGVTIGGFPSPDIAVQPPELEADIRDRYEGEPRRKFADGGGIREGYVDDLFRCHEQKVETVRWLNERCEFEFEFVVFTLLDRLLHVTEPGDTRIQQAYETIDKSTKCLVDTVDPDDVLVISDHGMKYDPRWKWKHIHDSNTGIWAGSRDFGLETHMDVTPRILEYYGQEMGDPAYEIAQSPTDRAAMEEQLEDLGYL